MKDHRAIFWGVIALAAIWMFVMWLLQQWWFIPLLVIVCALCVLAVVFWFRRR